MGKAYWYKNKKLIEVGLKEYKSKVNGIIEGGKTHIHDLVDNPEIFGYTEKKIKEIYKKYNETPGNEGQARNEIMKDVISKGWIRVRHQQSRQDDYWIIQFDTFVKQKKELQNLISTLLLDKGVMYKTSKVILDGLNDGFRKVYDGYMDSKNSVLVFLEGLQKEKVNVITEYKYFNY
jgi:hypothetical protein